MAGRWGSSFRLVPVQRLRRGLYKGHVLGRYRSHLIEARSLSAASVNLAPGRPAQAGGSEAAAHGRARSPLTACRDPRASRGARRSGVRTGNWLTLEQATPTPGRRPIRKRSKGMRDRVLARAVGGVWAAERGTGRAGVSTTSHSAKAAGRSSISSASTAASAPSPCRPGPSRR